MYKIALVNLPFASVTMPSLALTQLKAVAEETYGDQISVRIVYANHDFAESIGLDLYRYLGGSLEANNYGLGDWFFRQCAFPDCPDNEAAYFDRFFRRPDTLGAANRTAISSKRRLAGQLIRNVINKYALDRDDFVAFTSMFTQNTAAFALARELKRCNPLVVTAMGGANCESPMGQTIAHYVGDIDFVFSGPSLVSFPQFIGTLLSGNLEARHDISGVFSKKNTSVSHASDSKHFVVSSGVGPVGPQRDINHMIPLNYEEFIHTLEERWDGRLRARLTFETSRGCWWGERAHCTFCGLNGQSMTYRAMEASQAVEQFERLFAYAPEVTALQAIDNILPKEYIHDVFHRIKPPDHVTIYYEVKADLTRSELEILARAHVNEMQPGIEALATSTLKLMKKGTSACQNVAFLKDCLELGIRPDWNLLVGFPGEREAVFRKYFQDLPLLVHLPPPTGAFPLRFEQVQSLLRSSVGLWAGSIAKRLVQLCISIRRGSNRDTGVLFSNRNCDAPYVEAVATHLSRLTRAASRWTAGWKNEERGRPELVARRVDNSILIVDSRREPTLNYQISSGIMEVACSIARPRRIEELIRDMGDGVLESLQWLRDRGLLFEEDGRVLSLIVDETGDALVEKAAQTVFERDERDSGDRTDLSAYQAATAVTEPRRRLTRESGRPLTTVTVKNMKVVRMDD